MPDDSPQTDWPGFAVRFTCGALFGVLAGFCLWWTLLDVAPSGWWIPLVTTLVMGFLAARYGDSFWDHVVHWPWWW